MKTKARSRKDVDPPEDEEIRDELKKGPKIDGEALFKN